MRVFVACFIFESPNIVFYSVQLGRYGRAHGRTRRLKMLLLSSHSRLSHTHKRQEGSPHQGNASKEMECHLL